jgi:hypothetical protein
MIFFEILWAMFILGLPVAFMSWYLISRLYESGRISKEDDFRTLKESVKKIKKSTKENKDDFNFAERRWMKFGGGFYGITAFTTWITIEVGEALNFIGNFPGLAEIFKDGIGSFIMNFFINQLQNFISALIWFTYWPDKGDFFLIWIAVPYLAYLLGIFVAGKSWNEINTVWRKRE